METTMPPDDEGQDLRSVLAQVVDAAEAEETERPERPERPAREVPEPREERQEAGDGERARGPDGKFLPKEAAESEPEGEPEPELPLEEGEGEPAAPAVTEPSADVPQHWSREDKDLIAGLPADKQQAVVDRIKRMTAELTPRLQEAAEIRRQYQGAMELFQPHLQGLAQQGRTPSDIIRAWASIEQDMIQGREVASRGGVNERGAQHVARMIQAYNIDPGAVAALLRGEQIPGGQSNGSNGAAPAAVIPPQVAETITRLEQRINQRDQAEQQQRELSTQAQIDAFANEKDETGAAKHPYFAELERDMMVLAQIEISQGKVPTIPDLYDRAVYANRETRSKVLADQRSQATRKAAAERKAQAEKATRAASSIHGSPGTGGSLAERQGPRSLRDEIAAAVAEIDAG
jgi:hypothetical protein